MSDFAPDIFKAITQVPVRLPSLDYESIRPPNMAEYAVKAIHDEIADFEACLDSDHEVGMPVVGGPAGLCVHVREIYCFGTDKLVFVGLSSSGHPVRLVQHLSQLNFLMVSAPKLGEAAVRIGFHKPGIDLASQVSGP